MRGVAAKRGPGSLKRTNATAEDMRWWTLDGDELGRAVVALFNDLDRESTFRRNEYVEALARYEGTQVTGLYAAAYLRTEAATHSGPEPVRSELTIGYEKALCDTVVSMIAAAQRPRPTFQTRGADWRLRRRAKKLDRFVEGLLRQPQGRYQDGWDLGTDVFLDATTLGLGAIKCTADKELGRVVFRRVCPWELYVDPVDAVYGDPRTLVHCCAADREDMIERYGSDDTGESRSLALAITRETSAAPERYGMTGRHHDAIEVLEVWRRARGSKAGKRAVVLRSTGRVLESEEWSHDGFPFAWLRWTPDRLGFWARSLVQEIGTMADELRECDERFQERIRICSGRRVYYPEASVDDSHLAQNDAEVFIAYKGQTPPIEVAREPLGASELAYYQMRRAALHDISGVSESAATARKDPGVTAAVAMREMNNVQSRRFQPKARAYEMLFCALGRVALWAAEELGDLSVDLPGQQRSLRIEYSDVRIAEDAFTVSVAPVSSLPNDPAGRLQIAQELRNTGDISPATFRRLLGWPDLERELNHESAEYEYTADTIDRYLDAEDTSDPELYTPPEGFLLDKVGALVQCIGAYYEAQLQGAPKENLELLRQYIMDLDAMIRQGDEAAAAAAAPPPEPLPTTGIGPGGPGADLLRGPAAAPS